MPCSVAQASKDFHFFELLVAFQIFFSKFQRNPECSIFKQVQSLNCNLGSQWEEKGWGKDIIEGQMDGMVQGPGNDHRKDIIQKPI